MSRGLAKAAFAALVFTGPAALVVAAPSALAAPRVEAVVVDRVVARFSAPELGGVAHPRFLSERVLAFEAALLLRADEGAPAGSAPDERARRQAMELHIVEDVLASLPADPRSAALYLRVVRDVRLGLEDRVGGARELLALGRREGLGDSELEAFFARRARATLYVDHAFAPVLHASDEQLRAAQHTAPTRLRSRPFADVRAELVRWLEAEQTQAAELTYAQSLRTRLTLVTF